MSDFQEGPGYTLTSDGTWHPPYTTPASPFPPPPRGPAETNDVPQNTTISTVLAALAAAVLTAVLIVGLTWYWGHDSTAETRASGAIAGQSRGATLIDTAWGNVGAADKAGFCETYRGLGPRNSYRVFINGLDVVDPPTFDEFTEHFDEAC